MTVKEDIDKELREDCVLYKENENNRMWISKTDKVNYDELYKIIAKLNVNRIQKKPE